MASCPSSARRDLRAREQTIGDASCVCRSPSPQIDVGQERACRRIAVDLVKGPSVGFRVETVCAEALKEALGWQVNWSRCGHMDRLHYGHPRHGIDHTIGWNSGNPYPCAARDVIASPEGLRCPEVEPVASNGCGLLLLRTAFAITTKEWQRDHEGPVCDVKARGRFGLEPTMSIVATQECVVLPHRILAVVQCPCCSTPVIRATVRRTERLSRIGSSCACRPGLTKTAKRLEIQTLPRKKVRAALRWAHLARVLCRRSLRQGQLARDLAAVRNLRATAQERIGPSRQTRSAPWGPCTSRRSCRPTMSAMRRAPPNARRARGRNRRDTASR